MAKPKASVTVKQSIVAGIARYKIISMTNYTDSLVGIVLFQDEIDRMIRRNITVHIK